MVRPLIIDYVLYNGEPIIEFRLEYLNSSVDYFVVIEAWYTHSGVKKPELFFLKNIDLFKKYQNKLIFKVIEKFPDRNDEEIKKMIDSDKLKELSDSWIRETYNRNCIQEILLDTFKQPFIVLVCDVDEIPKKELVLELHNHYDTLHEGKHIQMLLLNYGFRWKKNTMWFHPFVITDIGTKNLLFSKVRLTFVGSFFINSGWHVTYCFDIKNIIKKLESFAHTEFDKIEYKNKDYILTCMLTGRSFLTLDKQDVLISTNENELPNGWKEFQKKIDKIIFEQEFPNIKE